MSEEPKAPIRLRLNSNLIDYFREDGLGWQTRMNAVLLSDGVVRAEDILNTFHEVMLRQ